MEEHKRLFLEKAMELGFSIVLRPREFKHIDKPPYTEDIDPGLSVVVNSAENEAKVREWLDTEKGSQEAARYCLVCGLIPFTPENVALVDGRDSWHIGADQIPKETHQKFIDYALADKDECTLDDDHEMEHLALLSTELDGIHIENGRVVNVKVGQTRRIKVYQTYYTPRIDKDLF